jgi:hypothetical protein
VPRVSEQNLADLDDVEYRDYKRELLRRSRAEGASGQSAIGSILLCGLLFVAAGVVLLHHYGFLDTVKLNP